MNGLVYKSTGNWYDVHTDSKKVYKCIIKGKFRSLGIKSTNPVAVGDRVVFEITDEQDLKGLIIKIEDRENYIIRKSVNLSKQTHIIASNIDCCFLFVTPSNPQTSSLFIDRVLISTKSFGIETVILFNKIDIYSDEDHKLINNLNDIYSNAGYKTLKISVKNGTNIDWSTAEALAFGSLLDEGYPVRLVGQDSGRGTFSQRHSVLRNQIDNSRYIPLNNISNKQKQFEVVDSFLSELAV